MSPAATLSAVGARESALESADKLFYARGIGPVTMADVRDDSGVSFRRLYAMFSSKSELVAAWLEYRHETWMAGFKTNVETRENAGMGAIDATFAALESWMTATDFRGCGFINTHAEASDLANAHAEIIRAHKLALRDYLASRLPNADALAVLIDGAIVQASIYGNADPIRHANTAARLLVKDEAR
ncbi:MAG: TetR/AcrR family transcriptional regulator [Acidimicrobiales bacterium]